MANQCRCTTKHFNNNNGNPTPTPLRAPPAYPARSVVLPLLRHPPPPNGWPWPPSCPSLASSSPSPPLLSPPPSSTWPPLPQVFLIFSPVLVPAALAVELAVAGFLSTSAAFGVSVCRRSRGWWIRWEGEANIPWASRWVGELSQHEVPDGRRRGVIGVEDQGFGGGVTGQGVWCEGKWGDITISFGT